MIGQWHDCIKISDFGQSDRWLKYEQCVQFYTGVLDDESVSLS